MKKLIIGGLAALMWLGTTLAVAAENPGSWDGLIEIKPKRLDAAYLLPGADFRKYTKLMMDPVEVAFKKDWAKNYNRDATTLSQRLTPEHVEKIAQAAREGFTEVFTEAYKKGGPRARDGAGPRRAAAASRRRGSLHRGAGQRCRAGRSRTYTMESGEATLFLEVRDSTTGALLGRGLDRRATRGTGMAQISNSVTNISDFKALFKQWADISVKGFQDMRAMSPVPTRPEAGPEAELRK